LGKVVKDIVEQTFAKKNTNTYELSILIGMGSFDYVVLDSQQQLLLLKSYTLTHSLSVDELTAIIRLDPYLKYQYRKIHIAWAGSKSTLIPERLFKDANKKAFLEQTSPIKEEDLVQHDTLQATGLQNIYAVPSPLKSWLAQHFPGHTLSHLGSTLLEHQRAHAVRDEAPQMYMHLVGGLVYFSAFQDTNLLFYNSFEYQNAKDFIYYLLLAFKQAGLNPNKATVNITGQLVEKSEIYSLLKRYVSQPVFLDPANKITYGPKMQTQMKYLYFGALCLSINP
jgi:hypothetical protein